MQAAGVGPAATRKALMVLQGIFSCAVSWGHVPSNPVVGVRKPSAKRQRAVTPPSPAVVERMRGELLAAGQVRDATLVRAGESRIPVFSGWAILDSNQGLFLISESLDRHRRPMRCVVGG
jgi:hypothetical protein